jgi:hypothetical protein
MADGIEALASLLALAQTGAHILLRGNGDPFYDGIARAVAEERTRV